MNRQVLEFVHRLSWLSLLYRCRDFSSYIERYIFSYERSSLLLSSVFYSREWRRVNIKTMMMMMIKKKWCVDCGLLFGAHKENNKVKKKFYIRTMLDVGQKFVFRRRLLRFGVLFLIKAVERQTIEALSSSMETSTSRQNHYLLMVKLLTRHLLRHFSLHFSSSLAFIE